MKNNTPKSVVSFRLNKCNSCKTPCANQKNKSFILDSCSSCPLDKPEWDIFGRCQNLESSIGLGDIVYKIANPIAQVIDSAIGTSIATCGGCAKRREALNKIIPDLGITPSEKP
jgi:hypothetical protein